MLVGSLVKNFRNLHDGQVRSLVASRGKTLQDIPLATGITLLHGSLSP